MHALVTGGAGFVGRHLVCALLDEGWRVQVLDDLSTGSAQALDPRATLHRGDVRNRVLVDRIAEDCDTVFHLAAAVGPRRVAEDPVGTWSCNVEGSASVIASCAASAKRLIFASSSEVYGVHTDGRTRLSEDQSVAITPHGRRDIYAVSKLAAESLALAEFRSRLLPVTVVRFFNVVGPGQSGRYGMVVPRFAKAALEGSELPVYGDGSQRRCFLHVADAVRALLALVAAPGAEGAIVNVGNDVETSIADLADLVCQAATSGSIKHVPFEDVYGDGFADPLGRLPDVTRLRDLTGWAPTRTLSDIVSDVLAASRAASKIEQAH